MDFSLSQLRRDLTQRAIRSAIAATARVSIDHQRRTIRSLTRLLGETPMLRRRVRTNMLMALGDNVPPDAEILYFRRLGRVDKLNPDLDAGKQHEGGEALDQLVVAGGDTA